MCDFSSSCPALISVSVPKNQQNQMRIISAGSFGFGKCDRQARSSSTAKGTGNSFGVQRKARRMQKFDWRIWYDSMLNPDKEVQYRKEGGAVQLIVDGHKFTRNYDRKGYTIWECCQRKPFGCKVTVCTYANSSKVDVRRLHTHPIVTGRRERGQRKRLVEEQRRLGRLGKRASRKGKHRSVDSLRPVKFTEANF